jgi:hypothetical protein
MVLVKVGKESNSSTHPNGLSVVLVCLYPVSALFFGTQNKTKHTDMDRQTHSLSSKTSVIRECAYS